MSEQSYSPSSLSSPTPLLSHNLDWEKVSIENPPSLWGSHTVATSPSSFSPRSFFGSLGSPTSNSWPPLSPHFSWESSASGPFDSGMATPSAPVSLFGSLGSPTSNSWPPPSPHFSWENPASGPFDWSRELPLTPVSLFGPSDSLDKAPFVPSIPPSPPVSNDAKEVDPIVSDSSSSSTQAIFQEQLPTRRSPAATSERPQHFFIRSSFQKKIKEQLTRLEEISTRDYLLFDPKKEYVEFSSLEKDHFLQDTKYHNARQLQILYDYLHSYFEEHLLKQALPQESKRKIETSLQALIKKMEEVIQQATSFESQTDQTVLAGVHNKTHKTASLILDAYFTVKQEIFRVSGQQTHLDFFEKFLQETPQQATSSSSSSSSSQVKKRTLEPSSFEVPRERKRRRITPLNPQERQAAINALEQEIQSIQEYAQRYYLYSRTEDFTNLSKIQCYVTNQKFSKTKRLASATSDSERRKLYNDWETALKRHLINTKLLANNLLGYECYPLDR